jgi:hypothetical protein
MPHGLPIDFTHFETLRLHAPLRLHGTRGVRFLTPPQRLVEVDLRKDAGPEVIEDMRAAWAVEDAGPINAFVVWAESRLAPGVRLSTRRTTSWAPVAYRIRPASFRAAQVEFRLSLTAKTFWTAIMTEGTRSETQSYSPADAAKELVHDLKSRQPRVSPQGEALIERLT